jgi:X-X-X-Leu-X-X-Gly heptad repeat protein
MRRIYSLPSVAPFVFLSLLAPLCAQDPDTAELPAIQNLQPVEPPDGISNDRILGVIPNFATVSDPHQVFSPLTSRQKFTLFVKETADPYTFVSAAMGAGLSQASNGTPQYGDGLASYSQRVGAAYVDMATQNFFADYLLSSVLHEDPRYYRMGPAHSIPRRIWYSVTRLIISRTDSGKTCFNFSGVGGMAMGIALSNAYYPGKSVSGSVTSGRFTSSMTSSALGNLLPEFWPDFKEKLDRWRHKP